MYFLQGNLPWLQHTSSISLKFEQNCHWKYPGELCLTWCCVLEVCDVLISWILNVRPIFAVGIRKKSACARWDEWGGWQITTMLQFWRNHFTVMAEWAHPSVCGTDFTQVFFFSKSSWRIWGMISCLVCSWFPSPLELLDGLWPLIHELSQLFPNFEQLMAAHSLDHFQSHHILLWTF